MSEAEKKEEGAEAAPKKSKKKLIIIIVAVLVLLGGGGAGFMVMQSNKAKAELEKKKLEAEAGDHEDEGDGNPEHKHDDKHPPTFVQLDKFVFNLSEAPNDKTGVGQVEMQVLVEDPKVGEVMKNYMPIIRNNVLLLMTSKAYDEIATPDGKLKLQEEIMDAIRKPMPPRADKGKDKGRGVISVHFTSFIMN